MVEVDPQVIIDLLGNKIAQLEVNNAILLAQLAELTAETEETSEGVPE